MGNLPLDVMVPSGNPACRTRACSSSRLAGFAQPEPSFGGPRLVCDVALPYPGLPCSVQYCAAVSAFDKFWPGLVWSHSAGLTGGGLVADVVCSVYAACLCVLGVDYVL